MAVERFNPTVLLMAGMPPLIVNARAMRDCGCSVFIGVRTDRMPPEPATLAAPCTDEHMPLIEHFDLLFKESLVEPQPRKLVDVVVELLEQAEKYAEVPS